TLSGRGVSMMFSRLRRLGQTVSRVSSSKRSPSPKCRLRFHQLESRDTPSHTVTINGPPVLTGPEGTEVSFTSTVAGATSPTYEWTVVKDMAATPFATGTTADFKFTPDDNGSYVIKLVVTDGATDATGGHTATDTETFTATNVAPTATLTGPPVTVPGQAVS